MYEGLLRELEKSSFLVFLTSEAVYIQKITELVRTIAKNKKRVCYVCLSNTFDDVVEWMKSGDVDSGNFYFIDTLSSYYGEKANTELCFYVSSPSALDEIKSAISFALIKKGCEMVIIDAISSLLEYGDLFSILRFTHKLMTENKCAEAKKLYIVLRGGLIPEEEGRLLTDLQMFADLIIEI